ncbi:MAG: hypothetical protein AABX54_00295 [Nanoarchaeota archaeon]
MKIIKLKNKKAEGILESETLRVVIAVMCILLLVVLAYKLYGLFTKKTDVEQAKETLEQIVSKMNGLKEGGKDEFLVVSPKNWVLMSDKEQVCICSFENEGTDFFRSENRENAFQTCVTNGFCASVKNSISPSDVCGWGAFGSCIDFRNLPLKIYFEKKEGTVSIKTRLESAVSSMFEPILNYKKDENSKTIKDLIAELIPLLDEGSFLQSTFRTGPVAERDKIRSEITSNFESYLSTIDTKKQFNVERDKLGWKMIMYKLNDKSETEGKWIPVGERYFTYPKEIASTSADINGYQLRLYLYDAT